MNDRTRVHGSAPSESRKASLVALAVAGILASGAAVAQESTAGQENLGEIVVTAQKREQKLQEVPIAISVVDANAIEKMGGFNIEGLKNLVPSLTLRKTNVSLNQALFLRGIGTVSFALAAQPSVGFVLDGVVLTGAGEAFGDMYDVERMEVLRGPQGTLFGKNASAGVINVVTKKPGREFGGYAEVGYFEDDEMKLKAAIDTPVSDTFRGRTTLFWGNFPGYIDNVSSTPAGGKANGYYRKGARTVWEFEPSDNLGFTFIADYRKSDDPCCAEVIGTTPSGAQAAAVTNALAGTQIGAGNEGRKVKTNTEMRSQEESYGASLQFDLGIGEHTLTSITAYRKWDVTEIREGDFLDVGAQYRGLSQTADYGPQKLKTVSEELRIASPTGGAIDYIAGLYYAKTDAERFFNRDVTQCSSLAVLPPADSTGLQPCAPSNWVVSSASATFGGDFKNFAVFGDGTWHVTDAFRVIAGLRWTQDDISYFHSGRSSIVPLGTPTPIPGINTTFQPLSGSDKSSETSGRAGVQWEVTPDFMTYATYSRGYKGPAFNVFFNQTINQSNVLEAETADSYELGFKSTIGGGSTIVNAAIFKADYSNFQANNFFFIGTTLVTNLTNAGDVSTQGVELEFTSKPSDIMTLSGGVAYTDAHVEEFNTPAGQVPTAVKGDPLPFAPKWKGNLSAEWRLDLGSLDFIPSIVGAYQSTSYSDIGRRAALANRKIDAYGTIDATLTFATKNDKYRLSIIGRNLTDESYAALLQTGGPAGTVRYIIPRAAISRDAPARTAPLSGEPHAHGAEPRTVPAVVRALDACAAALAAFNAPVTRHGRTLAACLIAAMVALAVAPIVTRALFDYALDWAEELARATLVWSVLAVLPFAYRAGANVAIDSFAAALPPRLLLSASLAINLLVLWVAGIFFVESLDFWRRGLTLVSQTMGFRLAWIYAIVPASFGLLISVGLELGCRLARSLWRPDPDLVLAGAVPGVRSAAGAEPGG